MAGDLGKHGQRDSIRVNVLEAQELQAWCAEFGCTADQLKTAVSRAGVMATDVRAFLQDQHWIPTPRRRDPVLVLEKGAHIGGRGCCRAGSATARPERAAARRRQTNGPILASAKAGRDWTCCHQASTRGCFLSETSSGAISSSMRLTKGTTAMSASE